MTKQSDFGPRSGPIKDSPNSLLRELGHHAGCFTNAPGTNDRMSQLRGTRGLLILNDSASRRMSQVAGTGHPQIIRVTDGLSLDATRAGLLLPGIMDRIPGHSKITAVHAHYTMGRRGRRFRSIDAGADPVALLDDVPLTSDEAGYVEAARAANTLRGYRSDWPEFTAWCAQQDVAPLPAAPATVTGYLTELARHGAKVGTMSRRLSAIKFAHQLRNTADPTRNARVLAVWEAIRRTHTAPPEQAEPLMPPST